MNILRSYFAEDYDEQGKVKGKIEIKRLSLYTITDKDVPSGVDKKGNFIQPITPCLVMEMLDKEYSTADIKILKPIDWIPLSTKDTRKLNHFIYLDVMHKFKECEVKCLTKKRS